MDLVRKLRDLLTSKEQRQLLWLLLLSLLVGIVEMLGVASILPFIAILSDPSRVETNALLAWLYDTLGFTSINAFMIFMGFATFGVIVLSILAHLVGLYALMHFSHMRAYTLSTRLLGGYLRQPYTWFLNRNSADLSKVVLSEVETVVKQAFIPALKATASAIVVVLVIGLLIVVQPQVALGLAALLGVAYGGIFLLARRYLMRLGEIRFAANGQRYQIAQEAMGGIKEVKLLGLEDTYLRRFEKPARRIARAQTHKEVLAATPKYVLQGLAFGGMLLVILVMLMLESGGLTEILPILAVYAFAGVRLLPAMQIVYNQLAKLRFSRPAVEALHKDIQVIRPSERAGRAPRPAPLHLRDRLELVDVSYAYPLAERQALEGLSLTIPANTSAGIVGGTGAGKTTAVDIILGLLRPQRGELRVDGVTITPENLRAWQSTIGYVPQTIYLTDDTVAGNIAFGVPPEKIDRAAVERAARIAEIHDFVVGELAQGYDTYVGERGVRLSGGQRQRIGIARALYHDPDVLILDEATSALDNLTERAVMDAVHNLGQAKTVIMIAHRLSTVRGCDTIFMLERGRLVAQGPYDALIEQNQKFRAMAVGAV